MKKNLIPWRRKEQVPARGLDYTHPFELLHRQMNELFESFFDEFAAPRLPSLWRGMESWGAWSPSFDVTETDDEVRVAVELPGVEEKDVEVTLENNVLTIRGQKKEEREEKKRNVYVSERRYGQFQRVVPLPAGIDEEKVKARFKKGILTVTLPKTEEARKRGKVIEVTSD